MFPLWVVGMFGVVRAGLVGEPGFSRDSCRLVCARVGVSAWGGLAQRASSWGCLCATGGRVCQGCGMAWSGVVVFWVCCPVYWWVVVCCGSSGLPAKQEIAWDGLGSAWKEDTVMGSVELIDRPVSVDGYVSGLPESEAVKRAEWLVGRVNEVNPNGTNLCIVEVDNGVIAVRFSFADYSGSLPDRLEGILCDTLLFNPDPAGVVYGEVLIRVPSCESRMLRVKHFNDGVGHMYLETCTWMRISESFPL